MPMVYLPWLQGLGVSKCPKSPAFPTFWHPKAALNIIMDQARQIMSVHSIMMEVQADIWPIKSKLSVSGNDFKIQIENYIY